MELIEKYGRSTVDRVQYLMGALSDKEKYEYFRLQSFVNIWMACVGGCADINEHTAFFEKTSAYALREIDAVFFKKFGLHIEQHAHQLDVSEEEWKSGIKPCTRTAS